MARRIAFVALAAVAVAAVAALIFLIRAGDPGSTNWPITFELRSSDNGVLFQFSQDVFRGRALDWSFSPQVFVFPEIPISLVAYLVAGGSVQGYYLVVAAAYTAMFFLGLFAVIRYLYPAEGLWSRLLRAGIATLPLLLLPLLGTTWLFEYAQAPTYYFGMYLAIIVAPILFLGRALWVRIAMGVALALTIASNPLALVFTLPAFVCVLVVLGFAHGFRAIRWPATWAVGVLLVAFLIRIAFFGRLQGTSPLTYVSSSLFVGRVDAIEGYLQDQLGSTASAIVVVVGAALMVAAFVFAVILAVRMIRRHRAGGVAAMVLYFALVPLTGLAATAVLLITNYLYFWPVLILPLLLVLLPLPRRWIPWAAVTAAAALVVAGSITGGAQNLTDAASYFTYRNPETRCLDAKLPAGVTVGYSTFLTRAATS